MGRENYYTDFLQTLFVAQFVFYSVLFQSSHWAQTCACVKTVLM